MYKIYSLYKKLRDNLANHQRFYKQPENYLPFTDLIGICEDRLGSITSLMTRAGWNVSLGLPEVVTSVRRFDEPDRCWIPLYNAASRSLREGGAASKSLF